MDRALRDTALTPSIVTYDATGTAADIPGGMTNAAVVDSGGTAMTGSPFTVTSLGSGVYTISVPASATHQLDTYRITWNGADGSKRYTDFELVGGFYFSVAEARATDPSLSAASVATVMAARAEVEDRFEYIANLAFVPRGRRWTVPGDGTSNLVVPDLLLRSVIQASINGAALSAGDITAMSVQHYGLIQRTNGIWNAATIAFPNNVSVLYEYGSDEPPAPIKAKALQYVRHLLVKHAFEDDRLVGFNTDFGFARVETARSGSTGFPDIDSVLQLYAQPKVLVR